MTLVGHLYEAYGYSSQGCHIFLATGLTQGDRHAEPEEADLISRFFTFAEVRQMIESERIKDAVTVAALGLLYMKELVKF